MDAQMFNYKMWIDYIRVEEIKANINEFLGKSGFNILDMCEYFFKPQGYTGLWLLSESHLAVHTFPEKSRIYIELSSCVKAPFESFVNLIQSCEKIKILDCDIKFIFPLEKKRRIY